MRLKKDNIGRYFNGKNNGRMKECIERNANNVEMYFYRKHKQSKINKVN